MRLTVRRRRPFALALAMSLLAAIIPVSGVADDTPPPISVAVAGSFQSELGCPGDWQPECAVTDLAQLTPTVWKSTFTLPAGDWEYKATLDDSWDENYGANAVRNGANISLSLAEQTEVAFYYSHATHWITDSVNSTVATAAGSFQSELGCPGDWQPDCLVSWLQDPDGDGVYTFVTDAIPAGDHESKAALDEAWDVSYPASNLAFTVTDGATVTFSFVAATTEFMVQVDTPGGGLEPGDEGLVSAPARPPVSETIYFVMPDRFEDGDPTNDRAGVAVDDPLVHGYLPTDKGYYHGGDIAGLTSRLDYLDGLGVTAIWLTPMFTNNWVQGDGTIAGSSAAYHGYWQIDYGQIDPHFGTNAEMQALVAAAHTRGINVYFDIVANHTGDIIDFAGASTPYISKADQPYRDSSGVAFDDRDYVGTGTFPDLDPAVSFPYAPILSDPGDDTAKFPAWLNDPIYYHNRGDSTFTGENSLYGDFFGLDDLFTEHPVVQDGLIDIFKGMISDFDIDGFRLDTVKHVNDEFWLAFVDEIEAHAASLGKGDFYFFGEVFDGDPAFLSRFTTELGLPGVLDFRFHGAALGFAANSNATTGLEAMFADDDWFTDGDSSAHGLTTFVGNHDVGRFGHFLRQANPGASDAELTARSVLGHSLMFLGRGMPVVYYGDEQGFTGDGGDKDARHDMFVSQVASYNDDDLIGTTATTADANFDTTHPLYSTIAELAALRADHPALQTGAQIHRYAQGSAGIYAFSRIDRADNVEYLAVLNNAEATASATFATDSPSTTFTPLFGTSDGVTSDADGVVTVELPALGAVLYRAETAVPVPSVAPSVAIAVPAAGSQVAGRVEVRAEVDADGPAEVTFAASVGGGGFQVIGTDDAAPYRVFHDVSAIPAGTEVTYRAIVADTGGGLAADGVTVTTGDVTPPPPSETNRYGIIHYLRSDGDYGDHTTGDYNDFWGLHLWDGVAEPSEWTAPLPFLGEDEYGRFAWFELTPGADNVGFIVHRGDTKDGTDADRFFDPSANPEIWLRSDDAAVYTSQADAQGYVTIHYQRGDDNYGIGTSDYWGLHLWGDAIDPAEGTSWDAPKPPDGIDDYGAFWTVDVVGVTEPVNFIVHQPNGDTPGVNRELSIDRSFIPADQPSAWLLQDEEPVHAQRGEALDFATIRYHRADGDYGDHTSTDFNDFWGLHVWNGAASPNPSWQEPVKPVGFDIFGPIFEIDLVEGAPELAYIIHRGDIKDPGPDQFLDFATFGYEVWQLEDADPASPYLLPILDGGQVSRGDLGRQQAHWVDADTIVWDVEAAEAALCWSMSASLALADAGLSGADDCLPLSAAGTFDDAPDGFLHLQGLPAWTVDAGDLHTEILTAQHAVVAATDGVRVDATGVQIPGVLDDVYATDAPLGVSWDGAVPTVSVWAPTARSVALHRYENSTTDTVDVLELTRSGGVWSVTGDPSWNGDFYLYEVEVFVPSTGMVETNMVTDPYSVSLAQNSTRSQIVDLADPSLVPDGWGDLSKPQVGSFEEIAIYEIHVRDFSVNDPTVPDDLKGTFAAFTVDGSDGMTHLAGLAEAGITHLHLLPAFDIATIDEDKDNWESPDFADLHASPPDSEEQQALVSAVRDLDGFNWGYDPLHYTTPEGSYSTDPDGPQRTVEFREMVASINDTGLGVVMDVVYNHTNSAGQAATSVLDRLVPGYYQRLDADGVVATSTCCANTATEHEMMGRLMVDSVVTWAKEYKVDGFRFDLMGHHSKQNMADVRAALDALTLDADGVDGSAIFLYGEGWNFGEVANDARFVQATQANMAGTGIATFNDRLRDGVRGGGPFDGGLGLRINQGFINGLWYDPNEVAMPEADALAELLLSADQIRVGLAGNLADFTFVDRTGATVTGAQVDYNASPTGYNADPQENIVYVSAHDNQTLFDIGQYHHPMDATIEERVRAQNLGIDITALAQGVSFFHAGVDMLRSKSLDRDSFNSGDWFNRLDFTYQDNGWGSGLPPEGVNGDNWDIMRPLLGSLESPSPDDIEATVAHMQEILAIRTSSDLFSLQTAADVHDRVAFHNTGPDQTPGLIVMSIDDTVGDDLDPEADAVWTLINASDEPAVFEVSELDGADVVLHPVQAVSVDPVVRTASFEGGVFSIPARTTAVFVELEPDTTAPTVEASLDLIHERGTNGVFDVSVTCTDDRSAVTIEIDINGVEVDDGTRVFLITSGGPQRWRQIGGETWIWAPTFIMTVRCTDEAGNTTVVVVEPDLTPPGAQ